MAAASGKEKSCRYIAVPWARPPGVGKSLAPSSHRPMADAEYTAAKLGEGGGKRGWYEGGVGIEHGHEMDRHLCRRRAQASPWGAAAPDRAGDFHLQAAAASFWTDCWAVMC